MDDAQEIARLRARVAELEAAPQSDPVAERAPAWRAISAGALLTLACVLAPLAVTAVWASTVLSDTDRYVATVAPVADDPAVQAAVADEVTTAIMDELAIEELTEEALTTLARQEGMPPRVAAGIPGLAVPLTRGVEGYTRTQVERLLASPDFAVVWAEVNRAAHGQVVALLAGTEGGPLRAEQTARR